MVATGAHGEVITEIVDETRARKINLQSVDRRRLDDLAFNHQGVVAEAAAYVYADLEEVIAAAKAVGSSGGTSKQFSPSRSTSLIAGKSTATVGSPAAR